ncbi:NIPSNAP family protein [Shinella yambaruensis]|uniref:NIPSNAP family protein n=1 Tax=Shinella yambaruensis TaxID=415996 RepID=A0ABQ5ZIM9_9HYPH|nr:MULTISPECIES: NIPSNAP family protein [Shinella]MCJ8027135.1 NIPSNAP family protein [Shinella yambaruensis]MCU7981191.1 NIPSNAP family protein [Shinella yambaruensis]MCW5709157.1 NIPSNAP family protein [Shinella sp.]GLR52664.1 NIPSNAP family protein [Shinella yambaruensis]
MLLEERDYRIRAGFLGEFVENYMKLGLPIQRAHLGEPIGFFTSDIGELNHFVSMWRWTDLPERTSKRAHMLADPGWAPYLASIKGLIDTQTIRILTPTSFSPMS